MTQQCEAYCKICITKLSSENNIVAFLKFLCYGIYWHQFRTSTGFLLILSALFARISNHNIFINIIHA
uniref:Uncharacterized protein n=1 Tax=Rhizophora mucronata TaxID=61149 RepID=A0A2P2PCS4_RHIMU